MTTNNGLSPTICEWSNHSFYVLNLIHNDDYVNTLIKYFNSFVNIFKYFLCIFKEKHQIIVELRKGWIVIDTF